ncbi:MAG TPA: hypothetical protein VGV37_26990 [Aliidongia sp.]|uniref:hypothetical protein n=1 Tax=Aliidongia sp. TaxID=1914230 RepID=UPI002DDCA15E|nr:hypothetical protein [Aliidongia sp.]HEV2678203.1 hypothetical protein [Aliidongia sp.]
MTGWRFLAAALSALALLPSGMARADDQAQPRLTWVMAVPPPIHITLRAGPRGYADETLDWFLARLPDYRHEVITANSKRLQDMLAAADGICGGAMFKTSEREIDTQFSRPVYWTLPNQLIVSAQRSAALTAHLNGQGEVDLPALLADKSFVGSLQLGRSYSSGIDRAMAEAQKRPGDSASLVSIRGPGHFDMLASGRFDWTIGFPIEARWWASRLEGNPEKTNFLSELGGADLSYLSRPIAGSTGLVPAYIGCSKRPIGLAVIAAIDRLIDAAGPDRPWDAFYLEWLDPVTRADYLRALAAVLR